MPLKKTNSKKKTHQKTNKQTNKQTHIRKYFKAVSGGGAVELADMCPTGE